MAMTVKRRKDTNLPRVFEHKVADVRGGVAVEVKELGGDFLLEGTPLSKSTDGFCHVVKTAEVVEAVTESGTQVRVAKYQHFLPGDVVTLTVGSKAVTVQSVNRSASTAYDTLTLTAPLGAIEQGKHLLQAKEATEDNHSVLKYQPFALVGTGHKVVQGDNLITDAVLIGTTRGAKLPPEVAQYLTGIINY